MIQSPAGYQGDVRIKRYLDFYQAGYGVAMLSSGTTAFTPASLFAASEPGGWYDPSDLTTLYQDAAGTTPVTAVEQPVGLVLDKSKGLVLGSELVTNGGFSNGSTGWTLTGEATISGGQARVLSTAGVYSAVAQVFTVVVGKTYQIEFDLVSLSSGAPSIDFYGNNNNSISVSTGRKKIILVAASSAGSFLIKRTSGVTDFTIDNISVRELPGNHLSQSTAAARPVLSARVNLLTYTEQFDNAAWLLGSVIAATPTKVAADEVSFPAITASGEISVIRQVFTSVATDYVGSVELKAKAAGDVGKKIAIWFNDGSTVNFTFHTLTADWVRISVTETTSAVASTYFTIGVTGSGISGGGNQGACTVNIRRADLRPANAGVNLPAYQRVGAATSGSSTAAGNADYDTTGFPLYLKFDGTDDFLQSSTISPGSVDKAQVFAGVRKLSDPGLAVVAELSASTGGNAGAFILGGYTTGYIWRSRGSVDITGAIVSSPAAPATNVLTGIGDIAGDSALLRRDGAQVASDTGNQGTDNFGAYPLYVGSRGGTGSRLNGHLYQLLVRFSATNLDAATITATETWVNGKTKAF